VAIRYEQGRHCSVRTAEEEDQLIAEQIQNLSPEERKYLDVIIADRGLPGASGPGKPNLQAENFGIESVYRWQPVSMEEFLFDEYYLGASTTTLYDAWASDLEELFSTSGIREVILAGSIGIGKTLVGSISVCRILYELSCLSNPQLTFGLGPGSEMVVSTISKSLYLARTVLKTAVEEKLKLSPYFMENFAPLNGFGGEHTKFPMSLNLAIGSFQSDRVLGQNVFAGIMDEANFADPTKKRQIGTGGTGQRGVAMYDRAEKVFAGLVRRIKSRFQKAGGDFPGFMILLSSANTIGGFIDRRIKEAYDDPSVFVREYAQWDVRPKRYYTGIKFKVIIGSTAMRSQIVHPDDADEIDAEWVEQQGGSVIDVPMEYWSDFERDLEGSIRDIAGINTSAICPYFSRTETIKACRSPLLSHPFTVQVYRYGSPGSFMWSRMVDKKTRTLKGQFEEEYSIPKLNPACFRWIHIDAALSGDCLGIAMGHCDRMVEVTRRNEDGEEFSDIAPNIIMDLVLRVQPPNGEQIFLADIRRLIYELHAHGFPIVGVSMDQFQSADSLQQFKARGLNSKLISVDRTTEAYDGLRAAMYEKRFWIYEYTPFETELMALEYDPDKGKIDHPVGGQKDVADAVAGVVQGLTELVRRLPIAGPGVDKAKPADNEMGWVNPGGLIPVDDDFDIDSVREEYGDDEEFSGVGLFPII